MLALRADPWQPDHGMGFQVTEDVVPAIADPEVETADWSHPVGPAADAADGEGPDWFVDGVRRVELRLLADDGERRAPGLFGSFSVGSVCSDGAATFEHAEVGRVLITGGGLRADDVVIDIGASQIRYAAVSDAGTEPDQPLARLQTSMREAEGALAARIAALVTDEHDIGPADGMVLADGPLKSLAESPRPVVGVVKRFERAYLEGEHDALLVRLGAGTRTPMFGLGSEERGLDRYAWYVRLVDVKPPWHAYAGLVRCEVRAGIGLDGAVALADRVTARLPRYAGNPIDPRAPQNLAPVGALESHLRRRLGHAGLARRALMQRLVEGAAA